MFEMILEFFVKEQDFPFFIQFGLHHGGLFRHIHKDFTELVIVLDGTTTHVVENESYEIKKGDVFVIGSNTSHEFINADNFRICNIMLNPEVIFKNKDDLRKSAGFHALFVMEPYISKEYVFKSKLKLNHTDFDIVSDMLNELMEEYYSENECRKEMVLACFYKLIIFLSRKYILPDECNQTDLRYIANSVAYIENNFVEEISVNDLAKMSFLSERHFSRIFKEAYHTTPLQYILKLRLKKSKDLIKNTSLSFLEISNLCGFNDSNYFSRKFKDYYGYSPSEYRLK